MSVEETRGRVIPVEQMLGDIAERVHGDPIGQLRAAVFFMGAAFRVTLNAVELLAEHLPPDKKAEAERMIDLARENAGGAVRIGMNLSGDLP
ncbi:MAG TPA: hypothetical protein VD995_05060 [Azospirillum sp.]|nr:hypothetical protein [Azospirillum sp.]